MGPTCRAYFGSILQLFWLNFGSKVGDFWGRGGNLAVSGKNVEIQKKVSIF